MILTVSIQYFFLIYVNKRTIDNILYSTPINISNFKQDVFFNQLPPSKEIIRKRLVGEKENEETLEGTGNSILNRKQGEKNLYSCSKTGKGCK